MCLNVCSYDWGRSLDEGSRSLGGGPLRVIPTLFPALLPAWWAITMGMASTKHLYHHSTTPSCWDRLNPLKS